MKFKYKLIKALHICGIGVFEPVVHLVTGEEPAKQIPRIGKFIVVPIVGVVAFMFAWHFAAAGLKTSYGDFPGPSQVWAAVGDLREEARVDAEKRVAFAEKKAKNLEKMQAAADKAAAAGDDEKAERWMSKAESEAGRRYSGSPTYWDQIITSLKTVFTGFLLASAIAIPLGVICGLSPIFNGMLLPYIQVFKPVSPLAWLPIVFILVNTAYATMEPAPLADKTDETAVAAYEEALEFKSGFEGWIPPAFVSSAITVALCSLWPTLTNTALGVASIEKDHINVARVLKLGTFERIFKIIIPSSLPLMFAGLRISLGVGWMVLVAADMLSQNPGLGKFVWDMFQNGSSQTMSMIMVAVFTIGFIGLLLDRIMIVLQKLVSFDTAVAA